MQSFTNPPRTERAIRTLTSSYKASGELLVCSAASHQAKPILCKLMNRIYAQRPLTVIHVIYSSLGRPGSRRDAELCLFHPRHDGLVTTLAPNLGASFIRIGRRLARVYAFLHSSIQEPIQRSASHHRRSGSLSRLAKAPEAMTTYKSV